MVNSAAYETAMLRTVGAITGKAPIRADKQHYPVQSPTDWIQSQFYIPERIDEPNPAMQLAPYQVAALNEAYRTDAEGKFVYSVVIWSDIKKSAKSSIAAAVLLERARRLNYGSIKIVANDLKQADSRVAFYARRALELNKSFSDWKVKPSGYSVTTPDRTVIEAIPVDPKGEAGGNDDLIIFSELWAANQTAAQRMWTEMTLSPTKYGYSQRWVETYAGFSGESPLLEQLYETGVKQGRLLDVGIPGLELYANDTARLLCLWNTEPRLPWQTSEYYAQEAAILTPGEFERVHRNQWATSESTFVPYEWWAACEDEMPHFDVAAPVVCGMDAGVSSDTFALVGVSRIEDKTYVRFCRVWKPPKQGKIDFGEIDDFIRDELVKTYNVVQIAYDPHQLHDMATRLRKDAVTWMYEFKQANPRLNADKALYDVIRDRKIIHSGDPTLTEHIRNANSKSTGDIDKLRIVKRAEHLKIDAAVALSMANSEARRLAL
jgi:phage terminase large subunit-like protein